MSVNKAILVGNVGNDPEVKHLEGDNKVANFSLATSEAYKDKQGEKQTKTEWHRITVWGKLVDIVEKWVTKGQQLYIEGKIVTRSYDDKEGIKRYTTEIVLNGFGSTLQMIGKKSDNDASAPKTDSDQSSSDPDDDPDLPF